MLLIFFSEKQAEPAYVSAKICKNIEVLLTWAFFCNLLYAKKGLSPSALPPKSAKYCSSAHAGKSAQSSHAKSRPSLSEKAA